MPDGSRGPSGSTPSRAPSSRRPWTAPTRWTGIVAEAERIGFPVMVKAAAGGGGRGMRLVATAADLPAALAAGSAEALAAFGDGSVYLERVIRPARHIEVQLLGDAIRPRRRHRRAGLLAPAPSPEAGRGGTGARACRPTNDATCTTARSGSRPRPVSRTPRPPSSSAARTARPGSSRSTPDSRSSMA